jgi:DNA-binding Xre family transcriptional regulator
MIHCTLKQVVRKRGFSLYRLAKEADISYPTLLSLFHNRSRFPVLDKLCRVLRCKPGDLLAFTRRGK